jgi:hypothetical protein
MASDKAMPNIAVIYCHILTQKRSYHGKLPWYLCNIGTSLSMFYTKGNISIILVYTNTLTYTVHYKYNFQTMLLSLGSAKTAAP